MERTQTRERKRAGRTGIRFLLLLCPLLLTAQTEEPTLPKGKILFQSNRTGNWQIFVMKSDGSALAQLTSGAYDNAYPVWSPDGTRIAFKTNRNGNWDIYTMDSDGSNQAPLITNAADDEEPAWSPDGQYIAFNSSRDHLRQLYLLHLSSGKVEKLTSYGDNILPAWSPDGLFLAFTGHKYDGWGIYLLPMDRVSEETPLIPGSAGGSCRPDWSPDGNRIAYVANISSSTTQIWTMAPDGSNALKFTDDETQYHYFPDWTDDGQYLLYAQGPEHYSGNWEIMMRPVNGGPAVALTSHPAMDQFPRWFPLPEETPNQPPRAAFTMSSSSGLLPFEVTFDAGDSRDVDGHIIQYTWDFGDGVHGVSGQRVTHTFRQKGTVSVTLTVTDDDGAQHRTSHQVVVFSVFAPQTATVTWHVNRSMFQRQPYARISWQGNPENQEKAIDVTQYILYRKPVSDYRFQILTTVPATQGVYVDRGSTPGSFVYGIRAVDTQGRTSEMCSTEEAATSPAPTAAGPAPRPVRTGLRKPS